MTSVRGANAPELGALPGGSRRVAVKARDGAGPGPDDEATEPLAMNWAGFPVSLETVYRFEPVPAVLTDAESRHILGAQGNVWTEYIDTPEYVEYMAYPRALAMAEVTWSPSAARGWTGFTERLRSVLLHLDAMDVNYRFPTEVFRRDGAGGS